MFERLRMIEAAEDLYLALETIVRQNAGGFPIGHDAIMAGRTALAKASGRPGQKIDWSKESAKRSKAFEQ